MKQLTEDNAKLEALVERYRQENKTKESSSSVATNSNSNSNSNSVSGSTEEASTTPTSSGTTGTQETTNNMNLDHMKQEIEVLEGQLRMWKDKATLKHNVGLRLKEENETITKRLAEKDDALEKLKREISRFKDELEVVKTDRETIMSTLSEKGLEIEKLKNQITQLDTKLLETKLAYDELNSTKTSQIQTLQEGIKHLQEELDKQDQTLQENAETKQTQNIELENEKKNTKKLEAALKEMENNFKTARVEQRKAEKLAQEAAINKKKSEEECAVLNEALDKQRLENEELQGKLKQSEEKNVELETQVENLKKQVTSLSESLETTKTSLSERESDLNNKIGLISSLEDRISSLKEQFEKLEEIKTTNEKQFQDTIDEMKKKKEEDFQKISSLEEKVEKMIEEHQAEKKITERKHSIMIRELQTQLQKERAVREKLDPQGKMLKTVTLSSLPTSSSDSFESGDSLETVLQELGVLAKRVCDLQTDKFTMENKIVVLESELKKKEADLEKKKAIISKELVSKLCEMHTGRAGVHMDQNRKERLLKGGTMGQLLRSKQSSDHELATELASKMEMMLEETMLQNMQLQNDMSILGDDIAKLLDENKNLKKVIEQSKKT